MKHAIFSKARQASEATKASMGSPRWLIPTIAAAIAVIAWIIVAGRCLPGFRRYGYDLESVLDAFPYSIGSGEGAWAALAPWFYSHGFSAIEFWVLVSGLFSASFGCFIYQGITYIRTQSGREKDKRTWLAYMPLAVFCLLYGFVWFGFAHVRYGTAICLICAAITSRSMWFRVVVSLLAIYIHVLVVIPLLMFLAYKIARVGFAVNVAIVAYIAYYKQDSVFKMLDILGYTNYLGDLEQYAYGRDNALMLIRACIIALAVVLSVKKSYESKNFIIGMLVVYIFAIVFTPFSGRMLECIYPLIVVLLPMYGTRIPYALVPLLLVDGYFAFTRVIWHIEYLNR